MKKAENWKFPSEFGLISGSKRSLSVCNTVLHLGILRLKGEFNLYFMKFRC